MAAVIVFGTPVALAVGFRVIGGTLNKAFTRFPSLKDFNDMLGA